MLRFTLWAIRLLFSCYVVSNSLATPWTGACQPPLSMGFSRQEYWSGLPLPSPGNLPNPKIEPTSPTLAGRFFTTELPGKPIGNREPTSTSMPSKYEPYQPASSKPSFHLHTHRFRYIEIQTCLPKWQRGHSHCGGLLIKKAKPACKINFQVTDLSATKVIIQS